MTEIEYYNRLATLEESIADKERILKNLKSNGTGIAINQPVSSEAGSGSFSDAFAFDSNYDGVGFNGGAYCHSHKYLFSYPLEWFFGPGLFSLTSVSVGDTEAGTLDSMTLARIADPQMSITVYGADHNRTERVRGHIVGALDGGPMGPAITSMSVGDLCLCARDGAGYWWAMPLRVNSLGLAPFTALRPSNEGPWSAEIQLYGGIQMQAGEPLSYAFSADESSSLSIYGAMNGVFILQRILWAMETYPNADLKTINISYGLTDWLGTAPNYASALDPSITLNIREVPDFSVDDSVIFNRIERAKFWQGTKKVIDGEVMFGASGFCPLPSSNWFSVANIQNIMQYMGYGYSDEVGTAREEPITGFWPDTTDAL